MKRPVEPRTKRIRKTGDFYADTMAGFYRQEREDFFHKRCKETTWAKDFSAYLGSKIPTKYVAKVARLAYEQGHSSGEEEILNCASSLIDFFED